MRGLIVILCSLVSIQLAGASVPLQLEPMKKSPTPNAIQLRIVFPKENEMETKQPIRSQIRVIGYPLGVKTHQQGLPPLRQDPQGQTVRVVIDNEPYFAVDLDAEDSYNANLDVYRKTLNFPIPAGLKEGEHTMRAYTALSFGETIKKNNNFAVSTFYIGEKTPTIKQDLSKPYLTYNEPQGSYTLKSANDPILLDFYISNCSLGKELYKVKVVIDGDDVATVTEWTPQLIYGLKKGKHTVKLTLVSPNNERVVGDFNEVERTIEIN